MIIDDEQDTLKIAVTELLVFTHFARIPFIEHCPKCGQLPVSLAPPPST